MDTERTINVHTVALRLAEMAVDYTLDREESRDMMNKYRPAINKQQSDTQKRIYQTSKRNYYELGLKCCTVEAVADALDISIDFHDHAAALLKANRGGVDAGEPE